MTNTWHDYDDDVAHTSKARKHERRTNRYNERHMLNNIDDLNNIDPYDDKWYT